MTRAQSEQAIGAAVRGVARQIAQLIRERDEARRELRALEWYLRTQHGISKRTDDGRIWHMRGGSKSDSSHNSYADLSTSLGWTDPLTPPTPDGIPLHTEAGGTSTAAESAEGKES